MVKEEDLGVNFFLTEDDIGQSRGEKCCQHLEELNPDVKGQYRVQVRYVLALELLTIMPERSPTHFVFDSTVQPYHCANLVRPWKTSLEVKQKDT